MKIQHELDHQEAQKIDPDLAERGFGRPQPRVVPITERRRSVEDKLPPYPKQARVTRNERMRRGTVRKQAIPSTRRRQKVPSNPYADVHTRARERRQTRNMQREEEVNSKMYY
jgi:hypothetical protein